MEDQNQIPTGPGVIDVIGGCQAYPALADHLYSISSALYDRSKIFVIGTMPNLQDFKKELTRQRPQFLHDVPLNTSGIDEKNISYVASEELGDDLGEVEFCFANLKQAEAFIKMYHGPDGPTVLVTLFQELHEQYLEMVLEECPNLTVYALGDLDPENLTSVRFEKRLKNQIVQSIPNIGEDSMFGDAYLLSKSLQTPLGFSYISVLAAACAFGIELNGSIRPTLYSALLGDVGTGKSVAKNRAGQLFFGANPIDPDQVALHEQWLPRVPASDRGLYNILSRIEGKPACLAIDELRNMMGKGSIEGSTLMSVFCELWNADNAGVADKKGAVDVTVRLSMIGCLKVKNPAEFCSVFDYASAHGFYDRTVFAIETKQFDWTPWEYARKIEFQPSKPIVPAEVYWRVNQWKKEQPGRGRLGEIVLRIAYITSAINRDEKITEKALYAAMKFGEWQEQIRKYFQPAAGEDKMDQLVALVEKAFLSQPGGEGRWRAISREQHWHRNYGRVLEPTKKMLISQGMLIPSRAKGVYRFYKA